MSLHHGLRSFLRSFLLLALAAFAIYQPTAWAQVDQGSIGGTVQDESGAAIPTAQVILTDIDTGLVLQRPTDSSGNYVFSPIKIGNYKIVVQAPSFATTTQENVHLNLQGHLNIQIVLKAGSMQEVTVTTAPPLLQTDSTSTGQVLSSRTVNETPLSGRNWVYIAQLTAGVVPPAAGSRGAGTGDFNANGQRSEQNNFILDGVDNNVNVVDFVNGASYVVRPPPDALAEFKIDTGNYSAEFGHSAGAVINASLKTGTNQIHGSLWEYLRNDILDARDFTTTTISKYRENQFGSTLGLPIIRNRLFFFGDAEANRIVYGVPHTLSVPTALMRTGNFSELLTPSLSGSAVPIQLYEPTSGGTVPLTCAGQNDVFCSSQINSVAQNILNLFPAPNIAGGLTYNNYQITTNADDNTFQWDTRLDWTIRPQDQAFARFSYSREIQSYPSPLGPILDGGSFGSDGEQTIQGENFAGSETHVFNPNLVNEFRFGYNYGHFTRIQPNATNNLAPTLGLGGIPFDKVLRTGGLPLTALGKYTFGSPGYLPTVEGENVYQILDNLTKIIGRHSIKLGVNLQSIRFATLQASAPIGNYTYTARATSNAATANTGFPAADFLSDQMATASITPPSPFNDVRWYRVGYFQDDYKVTPRLMLNLGLRYEYTQSYRENAGRQANFVITSPLGIGTSTANYLLPSQSRNVSLGTVFPGILASNRVTLQYSDNPALVSVQKTNFAPRIGISMQVTPKTVIRGAFGLFFGGMENRGGGTNMGQNVPFEGTSTYPAPTCKAGVGNCPSNGITLESGFSAAIAGGLLNSLATPAFQSVSPQVQTPYSIGDNLTIEHSFSNDMVGSIAYVGSQGRHLQVSLNVNGALALLRTGSSTQSVLPFPGFAGGSQETASVGSSNYNSLQSSLEKRYSHGLSVLATYTWSHALDDAPTNLETGLKFSDTNLIPISYEYSNSSFDVRQRFTLNGNYALPFGKGKPYLNRNGVARVVVGGWSTSLTFVAQTGAPFSVTPANFSAAAGLAPISILVRNPFTAGGTPDPSNPSITCAPKTRTLTNWYNPCAFAHPAAGTTIPATGAGSQVTSLPQVLSFFGGRRNEVEGPGYERINMSLFKDIPVYREQKLQFRADIFNVLNTPAYGLPSTQTDATNGGQITTSRPLQNLTPDARFIQLAMKYIF